MNGIKKKRAKNKHADELICNVVYWKQLHRGEMLLLC